MFRKPYLRISGAADEDLGARFGNDFIGVIITDLEGGESDELVIRLRRTKPWRTLPPVDTLFKAHIGWEERGAILAGTYKFQRVQIAGNPEEGEEMQLVCRAADFNDALKRVDSEHFDEENGHKTYGDVLRTLAGRAGLSPAIDPAIAAIPLAGGYLLRWKQSAIGLATDIAEDLGAIVKPQAGALTVRRPNSFQSPSGRDLTPIEIRYDPAYAYQVEVEPRWGFGEVTAPWFDGSSGRAVDVLRALGKGAARFGIPHLAGSEALANIISNATAQRLEAESAIGSFEGVGQPEAVAGAQVFPKGFGPGIDDIQWRATSVVHDIMPERGWTTSIETCYAFQ